MRASRSPWIAAALVALVAAAAVAQPETGRKEPDVPYVTTPEPVVLEMLRLAKVTKDDVVYDLGSGDGRIVIAAAKQFGARGLGLEIDRGLVHEAEENARRAGVTDRVRFIAADIFDADLSGATVVTLYLFPSVNERLRPKLLRELKPGTRVVSHAYGIGDWKPEQQRMVKVGAKDHQIYFWVVPPRP